VTSFHDDIRTTGSGELRARHPVRIGTVHPRGGVLGLLPELSRDPLGLFERCARDYGDLVHMRLGPRRMVLINHPDLVEELLVTRNRDFQRGLRNQHLSSALGSGLLVSEGDFWLRQRRLMQPGFHRQRVEAMGASMVAIASNVIDQWLPGESCDIYDEMTEITLQIAARTLFGADVGQDLTRIRRSASTMTDHIRSRLFTLMLLVPDSVPTPGNVRYAAAVRELDTLIYSLIAKRRAATGTGPRDLLDMLLAARDTDGAVMTSRQVRDEVITIMSASYDTTALALTWAWVLLAQHPVSARRLFAHIDAVLGDRLPAASDVAKLPQVQQVVAETLRLYPSTWAIGREAVNATWLGGQRIRRGTTVLLSPWLLHRDARFFDEPATFRPERWTDGLAQRLPRFAYAPFGGGQRVCIGNEFAQLEVALVLTTIAQRFRIELSDPTRVPHPMPVLTLKPRGGVPVRLAARRRTGAPLA
jgi:cytochrome P450